AHPMSRLVARLKETLSFVMALMLLEVEGHAEEEAARWRKIEELGRPKLSGRIRASVVGERLRIGTDVLGPERQVASSRRDRGALRVELSRQGSRHRVRQATSRKRMKLPFSMNGSEIRFGVTVAPLESTYGPNSRKRASSGK